MSEERDIVERLGEVSGWHSDTREINERAASEIQRLRGEVERLRGALDTIAEGTAPPIPHGHYLAHRRAVDIARNARVPSPKAP
jgi:hypothetical protein